jgi:hypothetical protein
MMYINNCILSLKSKLKIDYMLTPSAQLKLKKKINFPLFLGICDIQSN